MISIEKKKYNVQKTKWDRGLRGLLSDAPACGVMGNLYVQVAAVMMPCKGRSADVSLFQAIAANGMLIDPVVF